MQQRVLTLFLCFLYLYVVFFPLCYLIASHAMAVENADFLILLAGHVVQALVGLHITDLSGTHRKHIKHHHYLNHTL